MYPVGLHIYYKIIHGPYNVKLILHCIARKASLRPLNVPHPDNSCACHYRYGSKQEMIAKQTTKRGKALTWSMLIIVYMVPFSWSVSPLIGMLLPSDEDTPKEGFQLEEDPEEFWKSLISIMWLPLDDIKSPVKEIIYVAQASVFLITASCYTSVNTVFVALIVQATGQFEILLATINDMDGAVRSKDLMPFDVAEGVTNTIPENVFGTKATERQHRHDPTELRQYLVRVIRHHQNIIA